MSKIPYGRQTITQDDINAVNKVLVSDFLTQGPVVPQFESQVAAYHGAKFAVAFSNGTAALHGAYWALGIIGGDEIITSPITFVATSNAAAYCGARPVFADIDITTYCLDINKIEEKITNRTRAVVPVAFAGYPVELKRVREIADAHQLAVIYDAAHAIASKRDGSFGMEYADMAILSFHPVKHVATGEGGMVLTNREDMYKRLVLFRNHGITKDPGQMSLLPGGWYYEMQELGYNYRLTDIQAALGLSQFNRINENIASRNQTAIKYYKELACCTGIHLPPRVGDSTSRPMDGNNTHSYHLFPIRLEDDSLRKGLYDFLAQNNIQAQVHYIPVHMQPYYRDYYGYSEGNFPVAEAYYKGEISLPMYHNISDSDVGLVIEKVRQFMEASN